MNGAFQKALNEMTFNVDPRIWILPELFTLFITYGGLLFDLFIVPIMLNTTTKKYGLAIIVLFHFFNFCLFDIGVFPLLGTLSSILFFQGDELPLWCQNERKKDEKTKTNSSSQISITTFLFLFFFGLLQVLLPLRHYYYHWNTNQTVGWTGQGELFAWRMMLTSKNCTGSFFVELEDEDTESYVVEIEDLDLNSKQEWRVFQTSGYAIQIAKFIETISIEKVMAIYGKDVYCELNGNHRIQKAMNETINLLNVTEEKYLWLPLLE